VPASSRHEPGRCFGYTRPGRPYLPPASAITLRSTLTALADQLDPRHFARGHRSTIVSLSRVREIQAWFRGDYVALLADGTRVTIGATYREEFLMRLGSG
jgi:two-component system, LytTR family, response regulator